MKHDKQVKKQFTPKGFHLYIEGPGRIDETKSIDLSEGVTPDMMIDGQPAYTIGNSIPSRIKFSKEYGNTVYDVVADFSTEGKETVLKQFQKLILFDQN